MPTDRISKLTSKLVQEMRDRQAALQRELAGIQAGLKAFTEVMTGGKPAGRKGKASRAARRTRTCAECGKTGHDRRFHFRNAGMPKAKKRVAARRKTSVA